MIEQRKGAYGAHVLVVGGGIGGLAAAVALTRSGVSVTVAEQAEEFGEIGAGLQLAPNATRILGHWGLMDQVLGVGVQPERMVFRDAVSADVLLAHSLGQELTDQFGSPYVVIHRTDLHSILLEECRRLGVELLTHAHVDSIERDGERVVATFADGRSIDADYVIGADGLKSGLRTLVSDDQPIPSGYVAYRGTIPIEEMPDDQRAKDVVCWMGPGMHLVQYPLRQGTLLNQVATFRSESFIAGEENCGTVEELTAAFDATHPQVKVALEYVSKQRRWPLFDRAPISNWATDEMVLLGDAAHPMLQYLAQGCCQALEDASALEKLSGVRVPTSATEWHTLAEMYQSERIPRSASIQTGARTFGEICHISGVGRSLRNELLRGIPTQDYSYAAWIYQNEPALASAGAR